MEKGILPKISWGSLKYEDCRGPDSANYNENFKGKVDAIPHTISSDNISEFVICFKTAFKN